MSFFDIFNNDAFSLVSMLDTVDSMDYQPDGLGAMGIFTPRPVRTETVAIESRDGVLGLIQTSQRGAPIEQATHSKRKIRDFRTSRIAKGDRITASELAFVRGHGEEEQVVMLQQEIARRLNGPDGIMANMELTMEHMRLGAVQGIVNDADGSEIYNWFTEFNVTPATEIAFNFGAQTEGDLRTFCNGITRNMARASKGAWSAKTRVHALCGDNFWDDFVALPEIRQRYLNRADSKYVEGGGAFESVVYGDIVWENYRGTDDGSTVAIGTDDVKFFPTNAPGAFLEVASPGEQFAHIGALGQRAYPLIVRDVQRDSYVDLEAYSYPLLVCTRPGMLQSGRRGA